MTADTPEQEQLGHYTLVREAGHGGMSVVYEARDSRIGRRAAVKVVTVPLHLSAAQREAMLARIGREARAIARLSHPNIVSIYDVGEQTNRHFLVMEYLDGETLRDRLTRGPVPAEEAANILNQVASALDAVHAEGVVHRDVKPSNVMLLPDGRAKLMDFGVARQADDTMVTQAGMMVGSPAYMAPEQVNGAEAAPASDRWSLGVLLYQMLAGQPPFTGQGIANVLYQVTHAPIPAVPNASPAVQSVLTRALDRDPARRYPSACALAQAFRRAITPHPPRTHASELPAASGSRQAYWGPFWGLAALLLAAVAGGVALRHQSQETGPLISTRSAPRKASWKAISLAHPIIRVASSRQVRRKWHLHRHIARKLVATATRRRTARLPFMRVPRERYFRTVARDISAAISDHRKQRVTALASEPHQRWQRPVRIAPETGDRQVPANLIGTWHGTHTHNPATLTITHTDPGGFNGIMTVQTHEALVRVAVAGRVSGRQVTMRETRVLSQSRPHAWDLGNESGVLGNGGSMEGTGTDIKGRFGHWAFSR